MAVSMFIFYSLSTTPTSGIHRNVGAPWPYALSMSGREDLCRVACGLDAALDVIMMRIGNVVSFPELIHKDGIGISYPQTHLDHDYEFAATRAADARRPRAPAATDRSSTWPAPRCPSPAI